MRILLLTHAFNSLAQRLFVVLRGEGHEVSVEFDIDDRVTAEAVDLFRPDVVVAPFLKRAIPEAVWRRVLCLIVHPGIPGDRGPSALDWAILEGEAEWGVTVLQAEAEMDAGPVWASRRFPMRRTPKSSLYRNEVATAAEAAVLEALARFAAGGFEPCRQDNADASVRGRPRPAMRQADRAIDWTRDGSDTVLRKIQSGDGRPGVRDVVLGLPVSLYDAHLDSEAKGTPGAVIGRRGGAICRATADGAVWIGHLRRRDSGDPGFKLPAAMVLAGRLDSVPDLPERGGRTWREIWYEERDGIGLVHFPVYNGALSAEQCRRLREVYAEARSRGTHVIVLMGGSDFWCNGMNLNVIEAADSPADESWRTINAIDDVVRDVIETRSHLTIAALAGDAGAGGAFMALAADRVIARRGIILNPHYKGMGNLYGSEYWTYLLPKRCGRKHAEAITQARLPMGTEEALRLNILDEVVDGGGSRFREHVLNVARDLAGDPALASWLAEKAAARAAIEAEKPLEAYRSEELARMRLNFYGFDPSYHVARHNFVLGVPKSRTPPAIAAHRRLRRRR